MSFLQNKSGLVWCSAAMTGATGRYHCRAWQQPPTTFSQFLLKPKSVGLRELRRVAIGLASKILDMEVSEQNLVPMTSDGPLLRKKERSSRGRID